MAPTDRVHHHADARLALDQPTIQQRSVGNVVGRNQAPEHGNIERRAQVRACPPQQRGTDCTEGMRAGEDIRGLQIGYAWLRLSPAIQIHHAGDRIESDTRKPAWN